MSRDTETTFCTVDRAVSRVLPTDHHRITAKFPRGAYQVSIEDAPPSVASRFPNAKNAQRGLTLVTVKLNDGADVTVDGFGMPFHSADIEIDGWVNDNNVIAGGLNIIGLLQQRTFFLVVPLPRSDVEKEMDEGRLPPPFSYPYGMDHAWNPEKYRSIIQESRSSSAFQPAYR